MSELLGSDFYLRPTLAVARELLGKILVRRMGERVLSGRIVEVEAYHECGDEAAHSFKGRTPRNSVMYQTGGVLYVYFIYGMHHCMNVVTEEEGIGAAVLIRAIEPLEGLDHMRSMRGRSVRDIDLTNGPAKCCQAFGIGRRENGLALDGTVVGMYDAPTPSGRDIIVTTRIGIRKSMSLPWRFCLKDNPWVSGRSAEPG
ncbi:MAG: DNA-3-methyladenine glycosylase [Bacteroidia bacterium]|nr:DNA-3-methyladenine glycosylase [Bacteroidia bacterium]